MSDEHGSHEPRWFTMTTDGKSRCGECLVAQLAEREAEIATLKKELRDAQTFATLVGNALKQAEKRNDAAEQRIEVKDRALRQILSRARVITENKGTDGDQRLAAIEILNAALSVEADAK